jgi:hypothetical protein
MRLAAVAVVATALHTGCVPSAFRAGQPPLDADGYALRERLAHEVPQAMDAALRITTPPGVTVDAGGHEYGGTSGEQEWTVHVRYVHADGRAEPLPATRYEAVMREVELYLRPEFAANGITVTAATPPRDPAATGFVIRYSRANGKVAGELVALIAPSDRYEGRTKLTVVATAWRTE